MKIKTVSKNYSLCWKFLNESKWYIVFSFGIFALMFLIGFTFPSFFREEIFNFMSEMSKMIEGKSLIELIGFIFLNNIKASFVAIIFGITFGIFPLVVGIVNGYLLGFVAREVAIQEGILTLWKLFPHGIFELPAIIISIGIGIKIGADLFKKDTKKTLKHNFKEGLRFFIFVIFPLILIAGIIESFLIYFLR